MSAVEEIDFTRSSDWENDPKHLLFVLARYKFAAKMMEGNDYVLEVGCGDGFASRIVRQHVGRLHCVDRDEELIAMANARKNCPELTYATHDIIKDGMVSLKNGQMRYQSAYAIDVLEHIPQQYEYTFLSNIADSVDHTVLIGTPSLESQVYASENSKRGHVNCKTAYGLRNAMRKHFRAVFMFGMNDEVLTTGFEPMRHYLFAIGVK